jgi:hypothetical protein
MEAEETLSDPDNPDPPPRKLPRKRPGEVRTNGDILFDPMAKAWRQMGTTLLAKRSQLERDKARAEAEWLARHLQLDERGRLPGGEAKQNVGEYHRRREYKRLTDFPRIPQGELERLEGIIRRYGLPMSALSSEVAAFVLRRVMMDWYRLTTLRTALRPALFTPEELLALLTEMRLNPSQFAEIIWPANPNAARGNIYRWLHGVNHPSGLVAVKVNRLIEQRVRRRPSGGVPKREEDLSAEKETKSRRERWRKQQRPKNVPISKAAQKEEGTDADEE